MTKAGDARHPMAALREVGKQWATEVPLLAGPDVQGVLTLTGAWMWDTVKAYLALMLGVPLLFYVGNYSTARGGLNHAKSDYGALE